MAFLNIFKWNSALCIVLIKAYRVQHRTGKQNKVLKENIEGKSMAGILFILKN